MVVVRGTRDAVKIEFIGLADLQRRIQAKTRQLLTNTDIALLRGANFMQQEVQESIAGNRVETRSVSSGKLANSIDVDKPKAFTFDVFVERRTYPGVTTTTQDVAKFLEFGTSRVTPRRHFRNTFARNVKKTEKIIVDTLKF